MRLSALQKYILRESYLVGKPRLRRALFSKFYKTPSSARLQVEAITKSIERLIDKGLMIGYGRRTSEKWFIDEVALTALGRKAARLTIGRQQKLPLR